MSSPVKRLGRSRAEQIKAMARLYQDEPETKSGTLEDLLRHAISHTPSTRYGGRPVTSISGNPPTKALGKISGPCSQCESKAKIRFETIQYCNKHYRYNLRVREDEIIFAEISQNPDFNLESWNQYLVARESEFKLYGVTKLIKYGYSVFQEKEQSE